MLADSILRLDPEGQIVGRLELLPIFESHVGEEQWADLFHTNSVEVLPRDVPPIGTEGDLLIPLRDIDTIAVVDFASGALRWSWGPGVIRRQHQPSLLDNDRLLVFDNRGGSGGRSRVIEVDPRSGEIVWSYEGDPPESFFSALRGGAQRLANGNTLITESDRGRAFEVTPTGEIVWEFYNPLVDESDRTRPAIYRMARLTPAEIAWID